MSMTMTQYLCGINIFEMKLKFKVSNVSNDTVMHRPYIIMAKLN